MGRYTTKRNDTFTGSILLLILMVKVSNGTGTEEARLVNDLLKNYEPDARPVRNVSQAVVVEIELEYNQLQDLDEPTQELHSIVWLRIHWNDTFLRWNASDYGGHSLIHLRPSRIWTPDLQLYHNMNQEGGHLSDDNFRLIVDSDGEVDWYLVKVLQSSCAIDISRFPFDIQECKIELGSWSYDKAALDLRLFQTDGIQNSQYLESAQWNLASIRSKVNLVKFRCCPTPYTVVVYTLKFERKALYYVMTIIFPSMVLSLLACISFIFPPESGERVSLVISVLLGLFVFMLIVNDRTPVASNCVPMITQFFNSIAASTVLALMATAFVLRLNHISSGVPVPYNLAKVRDGIAVTLCMKKKPSAKRQLNFEEFVLSESSTQQLNIRDSRRQTQKTFTDQRILNELQKLTKNIEEENYANDMKEEWHYTMKVFDRLFFVIFLIIFCALTGYVFSFS